MPDESSFLYSTGSVDAPCTYDTESFLMWTSAGTVPSPKMGTIPGTPGSGELVTEFLTLELYLCLSCTLISSRDS